MWQSLTASTCEYMLFKYIQAIFTEVGDFFFKPCAYAKSAFSDFGDSSDLIRACGLGVYLQFWEQGQCRAGDLSITCSRRAWVKPVEEMLDLRYWVGKGGAGCGLSVHRQTGPPRALAAQLEFLMSQYLPGPGAAIITAW